MRRLVVISSRKSKLIAASVGAALSLTSIHMAATARIASLKREQEQLEQASIQHSAISQQVSRALGNENRSQAGEGRLEQPADKPNPLEKTTAAAKLAARPSPTSIHKRQLVISIADRQLAVIEDGRPMKIYPIAVGASGTPSPDGDFVIVNHAKDPTYRHGDKEIGPGKDNPLGSRWMGLNLKGYGIHGTNVQSSVGKAASHGCFRMRKQDVEELYALVQVGDTVMVRRERDAMIAGVFASPLATPVAGNTLAAKEQSQDELAPAIATATVETTRQ
jgi:lipoprotein-anchoring transpeptidase ErfK/SrfK